MGTLEKIKEMGSIKEPWGLFDVIIKKDKIGDSKWHCKITSTDSILINEKADTIDNVVGKVYNKFKNFTKDNH
jgi:hypothetical protein